MAILTAAEVQELFDLYAEGLTDTCAVTPIGETTTAAQGKARSWSGAATSYPCATLSGAAAVAAGLYPDESSGAVTVAVAFPRTAVLHAGDKVVVNDNGVTWRIEGEPDRPGTYDPGLIVTVAKVPL